MTSGLYSQLMESSAATSLAADDRHVLASIVAIAALEGPLAEGVGLYGQPLRDFLQSVFPGSVQSIASLDFDVPASSESEEDSIRELLRRFRTPASALAPLLSTLVARRAMRPNHLWQDLGLNHRGELSGLMNRHFAPLARRNRQDMKWKKFFYRMTCSEEGFSLCAAPVCSECCDFQTCFGDESGPSLLARSRSYGTTYPVVQIAGL